MEKILSRVRMAERQVARRVKRRNELVHAVKKNERTQAITRARQQAGLALNTAIKARHEDWELGRLAPRRDVSKVDRFGNYWGSISTDRAMLQFTLTDEQKNARAAWAGGSQYLCIAVGDRVVVTEGPYKGKISAISSIDRSNMTVQLHGNIGIVSYAFCPSPRPSSTACLPIRNS
jgi:large subunit ribosomal protein L24